MAKAVVPKSGNIPSRVLKMIFRNGYSGGERKMYSTTCKSHIMLRQADMTPRRRRSQ